MISSIRWLVFGLLTLVVAGLFAYRQYTHKEEVDALKSEITANRDTLSVEREKVVELEGREQKTALAYAQVIVKDRAVIDSVRRLPRANPLPVQAVRVEALTGIRPRLPLPPYVSLPPSLSFTMQVCYDSVGHTALSADLEELDYRRARDSLDRAAYVRLSQRAAYSEQGLGVIAEPGILKRRRHKAKTRLEEINKRWGELLYFLTP